MKDIITEIKNIEWLKFNTAINYTGIVLSVTLLLGLLITVLDFVLNKLRLLLV
jgi:preprotein translocase SecE subunit